MGIGRQRAVGGLDIRRRKRADEDALPDRFEQPRERVCTGLRCNGTRRFRDEPW